MNWILQETLESLDRLREESEKELETYKQKSYARKKQIIKQEGVILGLVSARLMLQGVQKRLEREGKL